MKNRNSYSFDGGWPRGRKRLKSIVGHWMRKESIKKGNMMGNKDKLVRDEVKRLLYKRLLGTLSSYEAERLVDWEAQDPENERLAHLVTSLPFVEKAVMDSSYREAEESWDVLRHRIGYHTFRRSHRLYVCIAAAVTLLCVLLAGSYRYYYAGETKCHVMHAGTEKAIVYLSDGRRMEMNDHLRYEVCMKNAEENRPVSAVSPDLFHTVVTPRGGEYTLRLDDGSRIHLNAQSSLTVPSDFSLHNRSVNLAGEAYFDVESDREHPFLVQTGKAEIKVLGTRFCVKNYREDAAMLVTLEEGEVEINSAREVIRLVPGEQALVYEDGRILKRAVDTYLYCAWNQQRIAYDNEPLLNILNDLGRWYDFEAAYSSDRLRNLRFSMDIKKTADFNEVVHLLEALDKIQIRIKKNKVIVREL